MPSPSVSGCAGVERVLELEVVGQHVLVGVDRVEVLRRQLLGRRRRRWLRRRERIGVRIVVDRRRRGRRSSSRGSARRTGSGPSPRRCAPPGWCSSPGVVVLRERQPLEVERRVGLQLGDQLRRVREERLDLLGFGVLAGSRRGSRGRPRSSPGSRRAAGPGCRAASRRRRSTPRCRRSAASSRPRTVDRPAFAASAAPVSAPPPEPTTTTSYSLLVMVATRTRSTGAPWHNCSVQWSVMTASSRSPIRRSCRSASGATTSPPRSATTRS